MENNTNNEEKKVVVVQNSMPIEDILRFKPSVDSLKGAAENHTLTEKELTRVNTEMGEAVARLQEMTGGYKSRVSLIPFIGKKIKSNMKVSAAEIGEEVQSVLAKNESTVKNIMLDNVRMLQESKDKTDEMDMYIQQGEAALESIYDIGTAKGLSAEEIQNLEFQLREITSNFSRVQAFEMANQTSLRAVTESAKMVLDELGVAELMVPSLARALDSTIKATKLKGIHETTKSIEEIANVSLRAAMKDTATLVSDIKGGALEKEQNLVKTLESMNQTLESNQMKMIDFKNPNSDFNKKLNTIRMAKNQQLERLAENNKKLETFSNEEGIQLLERMEMSDEISLLGN